MFTARYGLSPYIKQTYLGLYKVKVLFIFCVFIYGVMKEQAVLYFVQTCPLGRSIILMILSFQVRSF